MRFGKYFGGANSQQVTACSTPLVQHQFQTHWADGLKSSDYFSITGPCPLTSAQHHPFHLRSIENLWLNKRKRRSEELQLAEKLRLCSLLAKSVNRVINTVIWLQTNAISIPREVKVLFLQTEKEMANIYKPRPH